MIHFVGAGPGAADLITMRGHQLLTEADVIIYAGSLVNPELLQYAKASCSIYNSASMTLEEVIDVMKQAEAKNQMTVRLHTGDPSLYGAIREQMDQLDKDNISYDVVPGVSSFCGAAAALKAEYTLPNVSQSVIITRMAGKTPVPEKEEITIDFSPADYNWRVIYQQMPRKREEGEAHAQVVEWMRSGELNIKDFISDYFTFDQAVEAYQKLLDRKILKKGIITF